MQFWRRSIQWQLILSMGSALLVSLLVVVAIYTVLINHLTQSYLVDRALPSSIEAMRNDIERILTQPLTAARDLAGNGMLRDWLAAGEDPARAQSFISYLEDIRAENQAFTTMMASPLSHQCSGRLRCPATWAPYRPRRLAATSPSSRLASR